MIADAEGGKATDIETVSPRLQSQTVSNQTDLKRSMAVPDNVSRITLSEAAADTHRADGAATRREPVDTMTAVLLPQTFDLATATNEDGESEPQLSSKFGRQRVSEHTF